MRPHFIASAAFLAALAVSAPASALGPLGVEAGVKGGVGSNPFDGDPNPLGIGLGARAGIDVTKLYLGANVLYYLGGSTTTPIAKVDAHSLLYGLELGYNLEILDLLTIRPQIGGGNYTLTTSVGDASSSKSNLYLEPAVVGLIGLKPLFVGADLGLLVLPGFSQGQQDSKTYTAVTMHAQIGVKL